MADWYVSSVVHTAVAAWAASTAYTVGQLIRPTAPSSTTYFVFRCTTAGTTSGTEPTWSSFSTNNQTVTNGTAVFTNVTGQSTYGWSTAAGNVLTITNYTNSGRGLAGDRVFLSSDHNETITISISISPNAQVHSHGLIQFLSVNRVGSVPPIASDFLAGAIINKSSGNIPIDAYCNLFWQGVRFVAVGGGFSFNSTASKSMYFKNCAFVLGTPSTSRILCSTPCEATFDNSTVEFGHVGQAIGGSGSQGALDFTWINTPNAIQGAIVPTALFNPSTNQTSIICRGVDLSAVTTMLLNTAAAAVSTKVLLDSCRIASGVTRYTIASTASPAFDEIELVNCYDGTNVINERHTAVGSVNSDTSVVMSGGAQDDLSAFSHKLASSSRTDRSAQPLDTFWIDVTNNVIGSSKTATIEVLAPTSLNNDDISLLLEYMGTAGGSSLANFVTSQPAVLDSPSALASSTASWSQPTYTKWSTGDLSNITRSNNDLTVVAVASVNGGVRALHGLSTGKYYFEHTIVASDSINTAVGLCTAAYSMTSVAGGTGSVAIKDLGGISVDGSSTGITLSPGLEAGYVIRIAVDLTARRIWFRVPTGNWNGNASYDPATGVGGIDISALTGALYPSFHSSAPGNGTTANFGDSAFANAVPSGFTAGWPRVSVAQKIQTTFTPQKAGRVRGLVRLGKPSVTAWINPQIAIG